MKTFAILAVLLAVVQTPIPVPRETANPKGSSIAEKQDQAQTRKEPANTVSVTCAQPASDYSKNANPAKNEKDGWDKVAVLANCLLVVVGLLGIGYAATTLRTLKQQTKATEDAAKAGRDSAQAALA